MAALVAGDRYIGDGLRGNPIKGRHASRTTCTEALRTTCNKERSDRVQASTGYVNPAHFPRSKQATTNGII